MLNINIYITILCSIFNIINANNTYTFLIHGIAGDAKSLYELKNSLFKKYNIYSISLELDGDPETSYTMSLNKQCNMYYTTIIQYINDKHKYNITNDTVTNNTYYKNNIFYNNKSIINNSYQEYININLIGVSQGGLISRCIIQKYNNIVYNNARINFNTLITIATPNSGIYYSNNLNNYSSNSNNTNMQSIFTFEEYWKDPYNYEKYLQKNKFITILNNEIHHNEYELFYNNFISLNKFIAIWTLYDNVVVPPESAIFTFYNISIASIYKKLELENLKYNKWYINDNLGLQFLINSNKYLNYMIPCKHTEFKNSVCFTKNISIPYNKSLLDIIYENI